MAGVFAETIEGDAAWWQARLAELAPCSLLPELSLAELATELDEMLPLSSKVAATDKGPSVQPIIFADEPRSSTFADIAAKKKLRMPAMTVAEREQHVRNLSQQLVELFEGVGVGNSKMSTEARGTHTRTRVLNHRFLMSNETSPGVQLLQRHFSSSQRPCQGS
ncbi:MAG: hypothetical protein B7Y80_18765 [Hyphomicrobium sp. 32-62-53]|nr:MAG: hypothetical protein B7Y80_18765 [Hyphomicrobium sp. 32-62-53]